MKKKNKKYFENINHLALKQNYKYDYLVRCEVTNQTIAEKKKLLK